MFLKWIRYINGLEVFCSVNLYNDTYSIVSIWASKHQIMAILSYLIPVLVLVLLFFFWKMKIVFHFQTF